MKTLILSLPDELKDFMDERIAKGKYANASDCLKQLLEIEQFRQNYNKTHGLDEYRAA